METICIELISGHTNFRFDYFGIALTSNFPTNTTNFNKLSVLDTQFSNSLGPELHNLSLEGNGDEHRAFFTFKFDTNFHVLSICLQNVGNFLLTNTFQIKQYPLSNNILGIVDEKWCYVDIVVHVSHRYFLIWGECHHLYIRVFSRSLLLHLRLFLFLLPFQCFSLLLLLQFLLDFLFQLDLAVVLVLQSGFYLIINSFEAIDKLLQCFEHILFGMHFL